MTATTTTSAIEKWAVQRLVWSRGSRQTWRTVSRRPMPIERAERALMALPRSGEVRLVTGVPELMRFGALERS